MCKLNASRNIIVFFQCICIYIYHAFNEHRALVDMTCMYDMDIFDIFDNVDDGET